MIKLRVEGIPEEVDEFVAQVEMNCEVLAKSSPYKNRGESRYVRVYVDVLSFDNGSSKLKTACYGMADCIVDSGIDCCKCCALYDESAQAKALDEDEERDCCAHRRERGTIACREGICKYFEKE